jgi:hypothetical protein
MVSLVQVSNSPLLVTGHVGPPPKQHVQTNSYHKHELHYGDSTPTGTKQIRNLKVIRFKQAPQL